MTEQEESEVTTLIIELEMIAEQLEINQLMLQATIHKWQAVKRGEDPLENMQLYFSY